MILVIDGSNLLHRSRSGFTKGEHAVCYNFFRAIRALVEQFDPTRVYFVTDGHPKKRLERFAEYKANRKISPTDAKKLAEKAFVQRQFNEITQLLAECFPVSVIRHPDHEADDVIYNIIKRSSSAVPFTVVSNDSDFTQLLVEFPYVTLYNPMTKKNVEIPDYDYVLWKSLRGDGSDNIPGIPGIGDKRAETLARDPASLEAYLSKNPKAFTKLNENKDLIKFFDFEPDEIDKLESSSPTRDWSKLRQAFETWEFQSMLKEPTWSKYVSTFDKLWVV
jgi:DNA polymerase-1